MRRSLGLSLFALVLLVAGAPSAEAAERSSPGELLVYSAPSTECPPGTTMSDYRDRDLIVANPDGSGPEVVTRCIDDAGRPTPDGEAVGATTFSEITSPARLVAPGATVAYATDNGCAVNGAPGDHTDWSADGLTAVSTSYRGDVDAAVGLAVSDRGATRWLLRGRDLRWPALHHGTGTIAFTRVRSATDHDIEVVSILGGSPRSLFGGATDDRAPDFSPSGDKLAFVREGRPWVAGSDGSNPRLVADVAVRGTVSWSPDGGRLVVGLVDGIATVDVDDGGVTRLTTGDHLNPQLFTRRSVSGADGYALVSESGRVSPFGAFCDPTEAGLSRQGGSGNFVAAAANPARTKAWFLRADGVVEPAGSQRPLGNAPRGTPAVGIATTTSGDGYWVVAQNGAVHAFGDAAFLGSMAGRPLNRPIVGMAVTPSGNGYWLVASDGGIFRFGDAGFFGSTGSMRLNQPVVGMAPTASGRGYWLFAGDGGIFSFGDARFFGSTGSMRLNAPVFGMASTTNDGGYWLFARDGGVFTFGNGRFRGSLGDQVGAPRTIGALNRGTAIGG